ncbi:MAG: FtsX-like permease family protein [Thermoguttaceae bacterium]|jgi:putative ABC transport system permease protein
MHAGEFAVVRKLVVADVRRRPGRLLLTILSTIAAACVVVWVVSGYDSLVQSFRELSEKYLGRYELVVLPVGPEDSPLPPLSREVVDSLRQDPAVAAVDPVFQSRVRLKAKAAPARAGSGRAGDAPAGNTPAIPGDAPTLVGTDAAEPPYPLVQGKWIAAGQPQRSEAAISKGLAERLGVKVGDEVLVSNNRTDDEFPLKIAGIVDERKSVPRERFMIGLPPSRGPPLAHGPAVAALYVPWTLAEKLAGTPAKIDFAGVVPTKGIKLGEFRAHWADRLARANPPAELQAQEDVGAELQQSSTAESIRGQALSATGISLLAALFIIFTTLNMGVDERIRQFAMLRAVALTKVQVGAMIAMESLFLGLIGWGGGLLAGWGLLEIVSHWRPAFFPLGVSLGFWCIVLSGICAVGGSLAASVIPAWRATRVSPLEAMAVRPRGRSARFSWAATVAGVLLISVNPLVVFCIPMPDTARYGVSALLGCPAMAIGFVLLAPPTVAFTERILGPVVARLTGVNPRLLATQLTSNLWRTVGTAAALTIGLGLFVAMQTWGYSMLAPFVPGDWVPDLVVGLMPAGIPDSEIESVRRVKGVVADQCVPLAVEQTKFAEDVTGARVRASSSRQDNCVMVGVDPEQALGGEKPMFDFQFVEGSRREALEKLKRGRYCLVPDHFQRESGLGVGGKFAVIPPESPDERVEYEIAGVVSMTGWHWMSKVGLRNRGGGRSAALMFAQYDQVRRDFAINRVTFFWMNLDGTASEDEIKESLQTIAQRNFDINVAKSRQRGRGPLGQTGPGGDRRRDYTASVNLQSAAGVRQTVNARADGIIWTLSLLPLVTLAVASVGVVNTVLSSIRARRWDMGVLRAIGVTRLGLVRMILAEAILVGIVACLLSLGFGAMAGYCGTGITRYINIRGGQIVPLIIPWAKLAIGFGATLGLCSLAALWPAVATGRTEPLKLLQAGRAAT